MNNSSTSVQISEKETQPATKKVFVEPVMEKVDIALTESSGIIKGGFDGTGGYSS
jgi:hypothetical protein